MFVLIVKLTKKKRLQLLEFLCRYLLYKQMEEKSPEFLNLICVCV